MSDPKNIPKNDAEVMYPMVDMDNFHATRMAGAANAKVLRSPSSKKNT
jgi:hypothetical protein